MKIKHYIVRTVLPCTLALFLMTPSFAAIKVDVYKDKGNITINGYSSYHNTPASIKVESDHNKEYIDTIITDEKGNFKYSFYVDPNQKYDGKINISGEIENFTVKNQKLEPKSNQKPSSSSSVGSGGGGGASLPKGIKVDKDKDSKIERYNAVIEIPKDAIDENTYVKIEKRNNTSSLQLKDNEKLVGDVYEVTKDKNKDFKKAVTVTLPFEKSKIDKNKEKISICYYDESNKKWVELDNIKVDFETGKVSGEVNHFTKFAVIAKKIEKEVESTVQKIEVKVRFNDLNDYEWARDAIEEMANKEIINGRSEGVFDPSASITRAEFSTLITKMLGLNIEDINLSFTDVEDTVWYTPYVKTAYKNGLISGRSSTVFDPNGKITREEMATIIGKVLTQKGKEKANMNALERFSDKTNIANWANENVTLCVKESIISGMPDGTFMPKQNANRAQGAVMLYKLYKSIQ